MSKDKSEPVEYGFNINKIESVFDIESSKKIDLTRTWSKKLLQAAYYINLASILFIVVTIVVTMLKPNPRYFAATPNGQIYELKNITP